MGIFSVIIAVANVHGEAFGNMEVLVDTVCYYTTLPRELLERLRVLATDKAVTEMPDGRQVSADTGWALVRLEGREVCTPV